MVAYCHFRRASAAAALTFPILWLDGSTGMVARLTASPPKGNPGSPKPLSVALPVVEVAGSHRALEQRLSQSGNHHPLISSNVGPRDPTHSFNIWAERY
ncbi:hypothetical protein CPB86DRAFT_28259 [Serendipita vermifera]|nr:hypothetical protein CPB86DRAFT_28259 [Serendipita vermifera]